MTDGQSEGARMSEETPLRELVERHVVVAMNERLRAVESQVKFVLETLQPSDTEELAERVTRETEFLSKVKPRLLHGFPLSVAEQRMLWEMASGSKLDKQRKRCKRCGGSGDFKGSGSFTGCVIRCTACRGLGYK